MRRVYLSCLGIGFLLLISVTDARAVDDGAYANPSQSSDIELMFGTLIPANNGLLENIPTWGLRGSLPSEKGVFEGSFLSGNGNSITYNSLNVNYRMDLPLENLLMHFTLGVHGDQYNQGPPNTQSALFTGGWQFGGGGMLPLMGPMYLRFDFDFRLGPGEILGVLIGLTYRVPGTGS